MKKIMVIVASLLALQAGAQFKQATLQASGLTCAICSNAINKALQKLSFAEKVQSNIKESSFTITFKPGAAVDLDAIRKSVEDAGFSMANLKVKANFDGVAISNDAHLTMSGKNLHFLNVKQQTLKGEQTIQVVDKKFVSDKVYKRYVASTKMDCIKTGVMQSCCTKEGKVSGARVYHVTI